MLNAITLHGRLTAEPELRRAGETAVTSFTLAVDRDFKNNDGSRSCDFIPVVAWRTTAELVSKFFHKGDQMICRGRLQQRNYTDKDGNKRTAYEVVAESVYFCGGKKESTSTGYAPIDTEDEELPF